MSVFFRANRPRNLFHLSRSTSIPHQCNRTIHLLYTAKKGKTKPRATKKKLVGIHEIEDYVTADFLEALCQRRLELWNENPRTILEADIDLRSVLEKYITPGICLAPFFGESEKPANKPTSIPRYKLVPLNTEPLPKFKGISARTRSEVGVEIHLAAGKYTYFLLCMQKAFDMLRNCRDVEFHIRYKAGGKGKEIVNPFENKNTLRELLRGNLHFHRKAIFNAIPESSGIIVNPMTNFVELCWAIGPAVEFEDGRRLVPGNITKSLWTRKKGVYSIEFGDRLDRREKEGLKALDPLDTPNFKLLFRPKDEE